MPRRRPYWITRPRPSSIPYQDTTLPGYLFLVDDSGVPRPTIIYTSGYDSTSQEGYFVLAVAAMRRGYNVLAFDGPGQGGALHLQKLVMRPDWEAVITPVVDYALTRPEIEPGASPGSATAWAVICSPGPPPSSTGWPR